MGCVLIVAVGQRLKIAAGVDGRRVVVVVPIRGLSEMIGQLVVTIWNVLLLPTGTLARRNKPWDMSIGVLRRLLRSGHSARAGDIPNALLSGLLGEVAWPPAVPRI